MQVPIEVAEKARQLSLKLIGTVNAADCTKSLNSLYIRHVSPTVADVSLEYGYMESHVSLGDGIRLQSREQADYTELLELLAPYDLAELSRNP